ncbi:Response regulator protein TmoT [Thalassoglobus neptunius]|uniref:Response regulator protein TmoT n=1 Tax=Thalassoglobus neptunius TaxID=1938619 RepID=A0A5C5WPD3_9PLAN|nr:response regulator [Thalassoglobus neptunius]TWT51702.1 Response regulator protein TmoT [Thalassoglobus neptunius]
MPVQPTPTVYIVDDDHQMRGLIVNIVKSVKLNSRVFASADEFVSEYDGQPGCLISDFKMPGMNGLELLESPNSLGICLPCILITGHADVPLAVRAMKSHAVDMIEKPFLPQFLIESVLKAIELDERSRESSERSLEIGRAIESLTSREKEVLEGVVSGMANKQMAYKLDVSTKTIEVHRRNMMQKMRFHWVAELVRAVTEHRILQAESTGV